MAAQAMTYQETLRTLGMLLDQARVDNAEIRLSPGGAAISTSASWAWPREWSAEALAQESARQQSWRVGNTPREHRHDGVRWGLRVVGVELDVEGAGPYTIAVHPDAVHVHKPDGHVRSYTAESLRRRAVLAPHLRGQAPGGA